MNWQDELRRLDTELAHGRITRDEHRRQREDLLATASGSTTASPIAANRKTTSDDQRWRSKNPSLPPPATTEPPTTFEAPESPHSSTPPPTTETATDATAAQRPSAPAIDRPTTAPSPADDRPTEVIAAPPRPPGLSGPQPTPPAAALPPLPQPSARAAPAQPPPDTTPIPSPRRHRPTWLLIALSVLVVLVLIIAAVWWLAVAEDNGAARATANHEQAAEPSDDVALADRLPNLPGAPDPNNSTMSIDKGTDLGLYSPDAAEMFKRNGAGEVIYRASSRGQDGYLVLIVPMPHPARADAVVRFLHQSAVRSGLTEHPLGPPAQPAVAGRNDRGQLGGSWYRSDTAAVSVWVSQSREGDTATMVRRLEATMDTVRRALPPG